MPSPDPPPIEVDDRVGRQPRDLGDLQDIFETFFGLTGVDLRAPLALSPREMRFGTRRVVRVPRRVRCAACATPSYRASASCKACRNGFLVRFEELTVIVPKGVTAGLKLRLRGKGNETEDGKTGDLYVELEAQPSLWKRAGARLEEARKKGHLAFAFLGLLVVLGVGVSVVARLERAKMPGLGMPCSVSTECASGQCLTLYSEGTEIAIPGSGSIKTFPTRAGGVCTTSCERDEDCPASMSCAPVEKTTSMKGFDLPQLGPIRPNAHACSPR